MDFDAPVIVSVLRYNAALGVFAPILFVLKIPAGFPMRFDMIASLVMGALAWFCFFYALAEIIHWLAKLSYQKDCEARLKSGQESPQEPLEF